VKKKFEHARGTGQKLVKQGTADVRKGKKKKTKPVAEGGVRGCKNFWSLGSTEY